MPYLAKHSSGAEAIFHNRPSKHILSDGSYYYQDDEYYWEYRGCSTNADDGSILLPKGSIKKLTGKEFNDNDEPINLYGEYV